MERRGEPGVGWEKRGASAGGLRASWAEGTKGTAGVAWKEERKGSRLELHAREPGERGGRRDTL